MRLVVILEVEDSVDVLGDDVGPIDVVSGTAVFRIPIDKPERRAYYARTTANDGWRPVAPGDYSAGGADEDELAALRAGEYIEHVVSGARFPASLSIAQLQGALAAIHAEQVEICTATDDDRLRFYGSSWDGTWAVTSA